MDEMYNEKIMAGNMRVLMGKDVEPRTDFIFKNVDFSLIRE